MNFEKIAQPVVEARKLQYKVTEEQRRKFLSELVDLLESKEAEIIEANKKDLAKMDPDNHLYDRLELTPNRISGMREAVKYINDLQYVPGKELYTHHNSSGVEIRKVMVPFGIIGTIYESRPNVTVDVAALCVFSGNCAILRGGSDAHESNLYLVSLIQEALKSAEIPEDSVVLMPTDRDLVGEMLAADHILDLVIPRGGQGLINFVREEARMPAIETGAGVCHTYAHSDADIDMAANIIVNAKVSRPSVCNALDTALLHSDMYEDCLVLIANELKQFNVEINADAKSFAVLKDCYPAELLKESTDESFGVEYLGFAMSVKVVDDVEEAIAHIEKHSSKHSECIVTSDSEIAEAFLGRVDAANVFHNVSTRFSDGFEYGLGAEIGISTQKLHARGPMGLEQIMTYKWVCTGDGIIRN